MVIQESDKPTVAGLLAGMDKPVRAVFFKSNTESCKFCPQIEEMLGELAELGDKFSYEVHELESPEAKNYGITLAPVILFKQKPNVRFMGIPGGYEFKAFLNTILLISSGSVEDSEEIKKELAGIKGDVEIKVFVTPTCPYCSTAVATAHKLAMLNSKITSKMIEAVEFRELAGKYRVMAVPKIVINDKIEFEGAVPENIFVKKILEAL